MAYGTASVPRVDKIVGPGNAWVAAAKALVARDCGIDFFAGPSEIVIVSDSGRADWIAADLRGAGRARPRCARRADHVEQAARERRARRRPSAQAGDEPDRAGVARERAAASS